MYKQAVLTLTTLTLLTSALVLKQPRQTAALVGTAVQTGWTPKPTTPSPGELVKKELEKRQSSTDCAYLSAGGETYTLDCTAPAACMYDPSVEWMGCCDVDADGNAASDCVARTMCYNSAAVADYCAGGVCGAGTQMCNQGTDTECATFVATYEISTFTAWVCANTAYTAFGYFSSAASVTSVSLVSTPAASSTQPTSPSSSTTVISTSSYVPPSPQTSPVTPPYNSSGGGGGGSHTGAIAGGAVGGIAVIVAVIVGVWYVLRLKKKKDAERRADMAEIVNVSHNNK